MTQWLGLIILILIPNVFLLQPVNSDEALIVRVCEWTPWKDVCQMCLSSAAGSGHTEEKELGAISINCSLSLSDVVIKDFAGIANDTDDDTVKSVCSRCERSVGDGVMNLKEAMVKWRNGKFHDAGEQVVAAYECYADCSQLISYVTRLLPLPQKFLDDFSLLKKYYLDTEAILFRL